MDDTQYADHCRRQLAEFAETMTKRTEHLPEDDSLRELAAAFTQLNSAGGNLYEDGPVLVSRLFTTYPDFAPTLPRDLLWFFAGDCLHYMADEEISLYQRLDELRAEASGRGEILDLREARANLLQLQ